MDKPTAEHLFEVINAREEVLRRLIRKCAYLKYVEARLGDRTLYADEILRDGFCVNMIDTPLCPLKVVTNLQEAVWDADIVVNALPSTEIRPVFQQIGRFWRERRTMPVIISLAKGVEAALQPVPHIITPTQMIVDTSQFSQVSLYKWGSQNPSFVLSRPFFFLGNWKQRSKGVSVWLSVCGLWFCYEEFQLQSCISIEHCSYNTPAPPVNPK